MDSVEWSITFADFPPARKAAVRNWNGWLQLLLGITGTNAYLERRRQLRTTNDKQCIKTNVSKKEK